MHIHGLLVQFSCVSIFQLDQSGLSHRLHIIRVHVFPVVPDRLSVSIWSLDTVEGDLRADKVRLCWAEDKDKEASTGEEPLATARLASGRKESTVTKGRPLNRRQHQGAEWGPHMAWRLLLLEEQRWWGWLTNHSKARNPSTWNAVLSLPTLQELQRTYKSAGGSEIQLSSLWGMLWKGGPVRCYWQWTHEIKEQEPGRWAWGSGRWSCDWMHPWDSLRRGTEQRVKRGGRNVSMISGQAGYILQQIKQDWYPDFPIKAKHIFKEFFKLKISMLLVNTKCFPCHYRAYFCLYLLLSPSMQSSSKQTLNKSLSH